MIRFRLLPAASVSPFLPVFPLSDWHWAGVRGRSRGPATREVQAGAAEEAREAAREAPQEAAREAPQVGAQEAPQVGAREAPQVGAQEAPQVGARGAAQAEVREAAQGEVPAVELGCRKRPTQSHCTSSRSGSRHSRAVRRNRRR
jgi:hypothetical protein